MVNELIKKFRQKCREESTSDIKLDISNCREENNSMIDDIFKNNLFIKIAKEELSKRESEVQDEDEF